MNQDNKRSLGYARDRRDVPYEIEIQIRVERRVHRIGRDGHEDRITVRRSSYDIFGGDVAAEAWSVLDYEWLTEPLGQPLAQEASDDVLRCACVKRDDHIDRTRRISLCPCNRRHSRQRGSVRPDGKIRGGEVSCGPAYCARSPAIKARQSQGLAARNAQAVFSSVRERSQIPR